MVLHLIIAGRDTTACLLSWMVYELTKNEDVQRRLHEEIMQKLPPGKAMDWKSLSPNEMPYLNGVIYEALRLWPPVPFDLKMAFEDDVLPGGWKVPKFASVAFIPYNMGRDPERYPEPLQFRPERWIPFNAPPQHEFPVFQAGPRICLGMDMDTWLYLAVGCSLRFQSHRFHTSIHLLYEKGLTFHRNITSNFSPRPFSRPRQPRWSCYAIAVSKWCLDRRSPTETRSPWTSRATAKSSSWCT